MVVNLQRKVPVDLKGIKGFLESATSALAEVDGRECAVAFVSDRRMRELNSFFRGKDSTTDVLSFPHEPDEFESESSAFAGDSPSDNKITPEGISLSYLGDIVISAEQAQKQAVENGLTLETEIKQLILHGLLHLCGYDHEADNGEMNKRELRLRRKLGI